MSPRPTPARRPPLARAVDTIGSARTAAVLIVALSMLSLTSLVIPQRSQLTAEQYEAFRVANPVLAGIAQALGLDSLFASVPLLTVVGLLAASIVVCTVRRIARRRLPDRASATFRAGSERPFETAEEARTELDVTVARLSTAGWRCVRTGDAVLAIRGSSGFWGSVLLHAALLVVLAGGIWSALGSFGGTLVLTEGQGVRDEPSAYSAVNRLPRIGEPYSGATLFLERMEFAYQGDTLVSVLARMNASAPSGALASADARVNHPFEFAGKAYLLQNSGLAADVTLEVPGGIRERLVVNLAEETALGWQDEVVLDQQGATRLRLRVAPHAEVREADALQLPATGPRLSAQLVQGGEVVGETVAAALGETVAAGDVRVTFHGAPVWSTFLVRGDTGRWLTYTGLWLCVAGIAWRFGVPERRLALAVREVADTGGALLAGAYRIRPWLGSVHPSDRTLLGPGEPASSEGDAS